jgi:DNA-binding beta-propeller fold protein YncE
VLRALLAALVVGGLLLLPTGASAAARQPVVPLGSLVQLPGSSGCLVDRGDKGNRCTKVRALDGPAPFLGSDAVAISPDARNVYVASSRSNAIAIFRRDVVTGRLSQRSGHAGCVAAGGAAHCARGIGLRGPNSLTVSPGGGTVYVTSLKSDAITAFRRIRATGELVQLKGKRGCVSGAPIPGCVRGRSILGPDVVKVSPDGRNVYVGSFLGSAINVFARERGGALQQLSGKAGCIVETPVSGCATGLALGSPEGLAVSGDGHNVYVAAATGNAVDVFQRSPSTGALKQATGGKGCIVNVALDGCTTGVQLDGANAVAVSPGDDDVYVTSLLSNSVTSFTRSSDTGHLAQKTGTQACVLYILAVGCSLGRAMSAPEGLTVSPDGANVYAAAFASDALDVLNRSSGSGALIQKARRPGCIVQTPTPLCTTGHALRGVSSVVVSPDGRFAYAAAFESDAVTVFRRVTPPPPPPGRG